MKANISKFITIGVLLLLLVLIVSHYPEIPSRRDAQINHKPTTMSKMVISSPNMQLRAN